MNNNNIVYEPTFFTTLKVSIIFWAIGLGLIFLLNWLLIRGGY